MNVATIASKAQVLLPQIPASRHHDGRHGGLANLVDGSHVSDSEPTRPSDRQSLVTMAAYRQNAMGGGCAAHEILD